MGQHERRTDVGTHDFTEGEGQIGSGRQASGTCGAARQEVGSGGDDDADDDGDDDGDENMRFTLTTKRWCRFGARISAACVVGGVGEIN